jgi:hypothetical protein
MVELEGEAGKIKPFDCGFRPPPPDRSKCLCVVRAGDRMPSAFVVRAGIEDCGLLGLVENSSFRIAPARLASDI